MKKGDPPVVVEQVLNASADTVWQTISEVDRTKMTVSAHVRESFQDGIPEFTRENCTGGWEYFIQQRLKAYLEQSA